MASGFPLYVDLTGNNCTVFGGGRSALRRVRELLRFGAKVTVIAPQLCPELREMSDRHELRHIPRKYYRGDCTNAQLCVAATNDRTVNIAISTEAKAKAVPVNVTAPAAYGNFHFPRVILKDGVSLAIAGDLPPAQLRALVEADVSRWKRVVGDGLRSRTGGRQQTEVAIAADVLNPMLDLGRPEYVRLA